MNIAKPRGGFEWVVTEKAKRQLHEIFSSEARLRPYWGALQERLIHTGHREGERIKTLDQGNVYLYAVELDDLPTLQTVYTILGQTLTIQSVRAVEC